MEKIIASRHLDVKESTKAHVMDGLAQIENEYHKLTSARVILDQQKQWYFVEIVLRGKNIDIESKTKNDNLHAAIDEALDKVDIQLRKHLDKVQDHHHIPVHELELDADEVIEDEEEVAEV